MTFTHAYREAAAIIGGCPLEYAAEGGTPLIHRARLHELLADNECVHGRLPGDTTPVCGCWQTEKQHA